MTQLLDIILPEIILTGVACVLFLMGCSSKPGFRRMAGVLAVGSMLACLLLIFGNLPVNGSTTESIRLDSLRIDEFGQYMRQLALLVGAVLALLSFPTNADATGNSATQYGKDAPEFFGFLTLSVAGLLLLCAANDLIVLFLALELVSIPTYVMVSMSRTTPLAQEAGLKYFFLGALSVALMLLGFSYLFGATGEINLTRIADQLQATPGALSAWQLFALVVILLAFAFKLAAFPLHFYAGDVYEGAGTSVTAFLAFVPKAAGIIATVRILTVAGGAHFNLPPQVQTLLLVVAILTMSVGNLLGLLQTNVKRVLAYSSVAHTGYMLVGLASVHGSSEAISGVIFYLTAYGLMNIATFGVLMLLPSRDGSGAAETYEDIAGQGRRHVGLGLAMTVACFSLIGLPLTIGFFGKLFLIRPALEAGHIWLVIILVVNAAVSAGYYLKIVATLFLRESTTPETVRVPRQAPILVAVVFSALGTLVIGSIPAVAQRLNDYVNQASQLAAPFSEPRAEAVAK